MQAYSKIGAVDYSALHCEDTPLLDQKDSKVKLARNVLRCRLAASTLVASLCD